MSTKTAEIKSKTINEVEITKEPAIKTGNPKFDNWFSKVGGLVLRSCIFLTGGSGSGKTTLMINLMNWLSDVKTSMYSREMRSDDVKEQTLNVKFDHNNAYIADKKTHPHFEDYLQELEILKPRVVIIDSLQVIASEDYADMGEEKGCAYVVEKLRKWVSDNDSILILIGHVTKDGTYAGASFIKHMIDAHMELNFDPKKNANERGMSWSKNRKGKIGEKLYYTFEEKGIALHTEEEWGAIKATSRDFCDYLAKCTTAYLKTANKSNPNYEAYKKECDAAIKHLERTAPNMLEFYGSLVKEVAEISAKYKM